MNRLSLAGFELIGADFDLLVVHTWLTQRATDWDARGRPGSALLSGRDLKEAEIWLPKASANQLELPNVTPLQAHFILASQRMRTRRAQWVAGTTVVVMAALIALTIYAFRERGIAIEQLLKTKETLSQSDYLQACRYLKAEDIPLAIAYLCRSLRVNPENSPAETAMLNLLTYNNFARLGYSVAHASIPRTACLSPTGTRFAVGFADGQVQLFAIADGKPLGPAFGSSPQDRQGSQWNDFGINDLAFSPDDKHLAVVDQDNSIRLWDVTTGTLLFTREHGTLSARYVPSIRKVRFSPNGRLVATAAIDGCGQVFDATTGETPRAWSGVLQDFLGPDSSVEFSADGHKLVATTKRGVIWWDVETGHEIAESPESDGYAYNAHFSRDGAKVIAAFDDGSVRIMDTSTGNEEGNPIKGSAPAFDANFLPDGLRIFAAWSNGSVGLWDSDSHEPIGSVFGHNASLVAIQSSSSGRMILAASQDGTARVWDPPLGTANFLPMAHGGPLTSAVFNRDDNSVLTTASDGRTRFWNLEFRKALPTLLPHKSSVKSGFFASDGKHALTATEDHTFTLWDAVRGQQINAWQFDTNIASFGVFGPSGDRVLALLEDGRLLSCDTSKTGATKEIAKIPLERGVTIFSAGFDKAGSRAVALFHTKPTSSTDPDGQILVVDTDTGKILHSYTNIGGTSGITVSPDGKFAAVCSQTGGKVIDLASGHEIFSLLGAQCEVFLSAFNHPGGETWIPSLHFTPDSKWLVSVSNNRAVQIWNLFD